LPPRAVGERDKHGENSRGKADDHTQRSNRLDARQVTRGIVQVKHFIRGLQGVQLGLHALANEFFTFTLHTQTE